MSRVLLLSFSDTDRTTLDPLLRAAGHEPMWQATPQSPGGPSVPDLVVADLRDPMEPSQLLDWVQAYGGRASPGLQDLHTLLYRVSRVIRAAPSEAALLESACQLCLDPGHFDLAWIGWLPTRGTPLRAAFTAGPLAAYAEGLEIPLPEDGSPCPLGPTARCILERRSVVCQDWAEDPTLETWRRRAAVHGIRASAALPIDVEGQPRAVLNLYSVHSGFFTPERMTLLQELVQDLGHALEGLAQSRRREQAEQALAARETEYRASFEQAAVGMGQVTPEGCFLKANRRFCELFGYTPDEVPGLHVDQLTHPEDRDITRVLLDRLRSGELEHYQLQKRYIRRDGRVIWVDLSGAVVRDAAGAVMYYLSAFKDITERIEATAQLEAERLRLRTLLRTIPDLVWLKDEHGVYQFCNPRFEAFFGAPEEAIVGKRDHDYVEADLADFFRAHDLKAMAKGGPSVNEEWVTFAHDGHRERLETIKTPMRDASGRLLGILGIARDVTQSRADQERLRKLSNAIEHSPVVIVITDRAGVIEHVNPRFVELTGYSRAEALGHTPRILRSGLTPPETYAALWATIQAGKIWHGELQNRKKNGELYWESTSIAPIVDDAGHVTHFVALKEDITHLKAIQAELQDQLAELRRWHEATLGREMRILDLKREVNDLLESQGCPPRYERMALETPDGEAP